MRDHTIGVVLLFIFTTPGSGISNWPGAARPGRAVLFFVNKEKNQKKDFLHALRAKPFSAYAYRTLYFKEVPASAKLRFAREDLGFYMAARPVGPCCRAPQNFCPSTRRYIQHRFNSNLKSDDSTQIPVSPNRKRAPKVCKKRMRGVQADGSKECRINQRKLEGPARKVAVQTTGGPKT